MKSTFPLLAILFILHACKEEIPNSTSIEIPQKSNLMIEFRHIPSKHLINDTVLDITMEYGEQCDVKFEVLEIMHLTKNSVKNGPFVGSMKCPELMALDTTSSIVNVYEVLCQVEIDTTGMPNPKLFSLFANKGGKYFRAIPKKYSWIIK